jgi:restriction system protein
MLIVDYTLPKIDEIPNKTWKKNASIVHKTDDDLVELPTTKLKALYEDVLYRITLRTIAEIYAADEKNYIDGICFNGIIHERNKATGQMEDNYILSLSVSKEQFLQIDLTYIDAKQCFKFLKGVGGSKLSNLSPIVPIVQIEKEDNRIIESRVISTTEDINLAEMDWEDFEHLVRQIFEWEFQGNGSEVKITQSSRDGGVDAIVYDPDPIRGGKIIIQAKRYTNTVGVSAVRDLYGTIINEGANKGILITTADYGSDSYKFAQDKPITLLNGGHLLYLMKKHGHSARIDLEEAKGHRQ